MPARASARRRPFDTPELDRAIEAAEAGAIVIWRGQPLPFGDVPERIARIDDRDARDRLYGAYTDALEALNPHYERRLAAWLDAGDPTELATRTGTDPSALAVELERFSLHAETPYYAALRRYLALIDIEQGDATEADLWHVERGGAWSHWFGDREVGRAVQAAGRTIVDLGEREGWLAAEDQLAGERLGRDDVVGNAVRGAYATLVGSPEWLADELGVASEEIAPFADFAAFVRLWRWRRLLAELQYELRLYAAGDAALRRAYYSGLLGHLTGVSVPEAGYLAGIERPFASVARVQSALLASMLVEALEQRHGLRWWREPASVQLGDRVGNAPGIDDALAELGYDVLDWRPVLRQIRTRLIGEMSGYGGPNITTRAGTRKV
ncbi:MAG TPA: hypothetical protein VMP86_04845 [Candidatus Binatia bacterium]|nr:hypothetical protein [Candidatus Binatia bacterium]